MDLLGLHSRKVGRASWSSFDAQGNVIVVGNTLVAPGNPDVLITKYDREGVLLWQHTFAGTAGAQDYGVAVAADGSGNCFVAAAVTNTASSLDIAILKYNGSGTLVWSAMWNGPTNLMDAPSCVSIDPSGNIYAAGSTLNTLTNPDYAIVKVNASGTVQWSATYDYAGFADVATGIEFDLLNDPVITGGSATAVNAWDYATVRYNKVSGVQSGVNRVNIPGVGLDNALAFTRDNAGSLFITGYREVAGNKDIQTVKLNSTFGLAWVQNYTGQGLEDMGKAVGGDNLGNVYITGHTRKTNGGSDFITIKYGPTGSVLWEQRYQARNDTWVAEANKLAVTNDGGVIVTGTIYDGTSRNFMTVKYSADGRLEWEKEYDGLNGDDKSLDLLADGSGNVYVSGLKSTGGGAEYATVKYTYLKKENGVVYDQNGDPYCVDNELIVKFRPSVVNTTVVDDRGWQYGELSEVVGTAVTGQMETALGLQPGTKRLKIFKIFKRLTTADSISISRSGREVIAPKFWSSFLLKLEPGMDLVLSKDALGLLTQHIDHVEVNGLGVHTSAPNDPYFANFQAGMIPNVNYPDGGINLDGAWDIQTGQPYVKVGVYDDPIYYQHEDFGDGTFSGSKIDGGKDYYNGGILIENAALPPNSHGTATAGVIGALRNNGQGVAGIAGGDVDGTGNTGAALYSMAIINNNNLVAVSTVEEAIEEGASSSGYGLHIQNHAWVTTASSEELYTAVNFCFQNECLLVAGRGNGGIENLYFPACTGWDEWRLSVGANGTDGKWKNYGTSPNAFASSFGIEMDLLAPGVTELVSTTQFDGQPYSWTACALNGDYTCYNGTSAASAHASGVAALLLSEHNVLNGRDNDLAPDDIEFLMQRYATDITVPLGTYLVGYDAKSGWGRIDATNTMSKIAWPHYKVFHSGQPATTSQTTLGSGTVILDYEINGISPGSYTANKMQVTHTYSNTFTPSTQILDQWARYSGTVGFNNVSYLDGRMYGTYTFTITGNTASVTATTTCYQIGGQWIPAAPADLKTAYSLHLYDPDFTSVDENSAHWALSAYPNPAMDELNIYLENAQPARFSYEIVDVAGRLVRRADLGMRSTLREALPIADLAKGGYTLRLIGGEQHITKPFLKY